MKKNILYLFYILVFLMLMPCIVVAVGPSVRLGNGIHEQNLNCSNTVSTDGKATFDCDNSVLTLNNYNGYSLYYDYGEELTIVLIGDNIINTDYYYDSIALYGDSSLKIKGEGSLTLNTEAGNISVSSGDLTITDNVSIIANGGEDYSINVENGDIVINNGASVTVKTLGTGISLENGDLKVSGDAEVLISDTDTGVFVFDGNIVIQDSIVNLNNVSNNGIRLTGGDFSSSGDFSIIGGKPKVLGIIGINAQNNIEIDGDFSIDGVSMGLSCNKKITINSGNVNIKTTDTAIKNAEELIVNGGNVDIQLTGKKFMDRFGIDVKKLFKVNDGRVHIMVPENEVAIALYMEDDSVIEIADTLKLLPQGYKIMDAEVRKSVIGKTIALDSENIANEVTIEPNKVYTYEIIEGLDEKYDKGNIKTYKIVVDGDYSLFDSFAFDGMKLVKDVDYVVAEGSTIITFTEKGLLKLKSLDDGEYKYVVSYTNGKSVAGKLIINKIENPKTGDNILLYVILTSISFVGLIVLSKKRSYGI